MRPAAGSLAAALAAGPVVADGGLSTVLDELGAGPPAVGGSALWTGEVLATQPAVVEAAHREMIAAGARVVLSAAYQVARMSAVAAGRSPEEGDELLIEATRRAVSAPDRAALTHPRPVWVAASIGPYGAALADGSEYRGRYGVDRGELTKFHRQRLAVLTGAQAHRLERAELWWCETIPAGVEVGVLADELCRAAAMLDERGLVIPEVVVTMTVVAGGRCPSGEPIDEALAPFLTDAALVPTAVGMNCCDPAHVGAALERLATVTALPLVAKPNLGSSTVEAGMARRWLAQGARLIGGCCGTGTAELGDLAEQMSRPAAVGCSDGH